MDRPLTRREVLKGGVGLAVLPFGGVLLQACTAASSLAPSAATAPATTAAAAVTPVAVKAPSIPATTVRYAMTPFGDQTFWVPGMKRGFFADAGITIDPAPYGQMLLNADIIPHLLSGSLDIAGSYVPFLVTALAQTTDVKMIGFCDTFIGWAILANPTLNAKSVTEFMQSGMSFTDAMKATMAQMKGQNFATDLDPSHRSVFINPALALGGMKIEDTTLQLFQDQKIVELAMANRINFAAPGGAPQVVTLKLAGWKIIVSPIDIINNTTGATALAMVTNTGPAATGAYIDANMDTVLRFVSCMYRTIDAIQADPKGCAADQIAVLNPAAGTQLTVDQMIGVLTVSDPLSSFEDAAKYFVNTTSSYYYSSVYGAEIAGAQSAGTLDKTKTYTPDQIIVAGTIYKALVDYKQKFDQKLAGITGTLSPDRQALVDQSKVLYKNRNYLDAWRFLGAATA